MSSMNEGHGNQHAAGGSGADDRPRAPVPPREHTTSKVPPIPAKGPGERILLPPERRSLLSESETRARSVRKYVCDIVHMQVSAIIVTRDF